MMPAGAYEDILNSPSLTRLVLFSASGSENAAAGGGADLKQEAVLLSAHLVICGIIGGHVTHSYRSPRQDI